MSFTSEFLAILRINVLGLLQRPGAALTIIVGVTCAIGVLVSMLAMGAGARREAMSNVRDDRIVVTSAGAQSAMQSSLSKQMATIVRDTPGIHRDSDNNPVAVLETVAMAEGRKREDNSRVNFPLYGVTQGLTQLRPELQLTAGRMFQPGLHEIIANEVCTRQYSGFALGEQRSIRGDEWAIVGHFRPGAAAGSCTLYADANSVMSAFGRDTYNQITVMLESTQGFRAFQAALASNPLLRIEARREREVVAQATEQFTRILNFASYFVGVIMAVGATLGAANSLYMIVDSRRREMATLRAIGFDSGPIVASIMAEALLLALPGALTGAGIAWLFFNGMSASPLGISFQLAVTPALVGLGIVWAFVMGLVSGLPPALQTARQPVTTALRAI